MSFSWLRTTLAAIGIITLGLTFPCFADNWPRFRGPTGQGTSTEKNLPVSWSLSENLAWRVAVPGIGWSSPIVWEDRVFLTSATEDGASGHVICIDRHGGEILWDKEVLRQSPSRKESKNSHATPTPVTDGKLVYAAFNGGKLVAIDFAGNIAWTKQDISFFSKHGLAVSPILYKDMLILPFDGNSDKDLKIGYLTAWDGAFILALDKKSGREMWRAKRGLSRQGHVTPLVIDVDGKLQLISAAGDVVQGFDPDSGQRIWTVQSQGEGVVPSIVYGQGLVFTSSGFGAPRFGRSVRLAATTLPPPTLPGPHVRMCPCFPPSFMPMACYSASRNPASPRALMPKRARQSGNTGSPARIRHPRSLPKAGFTAWRRMAPPR